MSSTSASSSSIFNPIQDKRELYRQSGWKWHATLIILALALLRCTGAGGSVAVRSSKEHLIFIPHITLPTIGVAEGRTVASPTLAETSLENWGMTTSDFGGGPPIP